MLRRLPALAFLVLAPLAAHAQMYRCVDKHGNMHYSQTIPEACVGQLIEQINSQGVVVNRILPPPTPAELAAQKAAEQKKKEEQTAVRDQERQDKALLASYTSVQDIDEARKRARSESDHAIADISKRIAYLESRHAAQQKTLAGYAGGKKPPERLTMDIKDTETDLASQKQLLAAKQAEAARIDAKFDAEKKRFLELTGGSATTQ